MKGLGKVTGYELQALRYAERYGIVEYEVQGHIMAYKEYWPSEGDILVQYDLNEEREVYRGNGKDVGTK